MHPVRRIHAAKSEKLKDRRVVLGVTGSLAAVEAVKVAHELIRHGAEVYPVMSRAARDIVHPNALQAATGRPVVTELDGSLSYLEMCGKEGAADLLLIAPCTANTIGKIAQGIDDTTVTAYAMNALGSGVPILVAPAAHETMVDHPIVRKNVRALRSLGIEFIEPTRSEDKAKMADPDAIAAGVIRRLGSRDLAGKKVVVIAGATEDPIDDVRVLASRATGSTGIELARVAHEKGGEVELWLGRHEVDGPGWLRTVPFRTTKDLEGMAKKIRADYVLVPAAIADYRAKPSKGKIPSDLRELEIALAPTPKIVSLLRRSRKAFLVGFKAESRLDQDELVARARQRMAQSKLDLIVANDVAEVTRDATSIVIVDKRGRTETFRGPKSVAAERIWEAVLHGVPG